MYRFLSLKQIVGPAGLIPYSRSTWWDGVRSARFPPGIKIGPQRTAWPERDIARLMSLLERGLDWRNHSSSTDDREGQ